MFKPTPKVIACAVSSALISMSSTVAFAAGEVVDNTVENVAQDMEVLVVSGSRTEKPLKDVAGSISVVTAEDIENQQVADMNQLFKYDPSVEVTGSTGGAQNFIVRGMGGDRVLMIKDGMRMNEGYGANGLNDIVGRGFIETDTLKQVEVAKGAASSLYGSDALGGIVVFSTKDASDYLEDGEKVATSIKTGYQQANKQAYIGGNVAFITGDIEHVFNVTARDGEEAQNFNETRPSLDISSENFFYKGKFNLSETDFIRLSAEKWNQEVKGDSADSLLDYFRGLPGYNIVTENSTSEKDNTSFQLGYHSETKTALYDLLNVSLYKNETEQTDVEYAQLDINANFGFPLIEIRDMWKTSVYTQDTVGFLSNASKQINEQHTLGYGLDIEKSESTRNEVKLYSVEGTPKPGYPQETDKFPTTEVFRAGLFVNDEISLMDGQLTVTPGLRFDMYKMDPNGALKEDGTPYREFDENNVSFNVGGLYQLDENTSLFAQYGQGFKVPAYDLAYINHDNSLYGYKIVPSDDLSPEKSDTFELGLRGTNGDFSYSAAIFYNKFDDFLAVELAGTEQVVNRYTGETSPVFVYKYANIDAVTIKGAEFAAQYYVNDKVSVYANAAYQDGKNDENDEYITSISPLSGVAGISYENDEWTAQLVMNWAARMDKVNEGNAEVAGYGVFDVLVNYQVTDGIKLNFALNNLTDKEYVRYANAAGHAESSDLDYLTEQGRNASVNLKVDF